MPRNEDGEFELVFGNRQLLSIFFIVVFLLGIFFVMGYIVGRSSAPGPALASAKQSAGDTAPPPSAQEPAPVSDSRAAQPAPVETKPQAAPPETSAPVTKVREEQPASNASETAAPSPGEEFLQVVAVARPDAEVITETLQKRGFRARIAPGPSDKVFRVLVGPVKNADDMGKLRSRLEAAGFKPIVRKY